MDWAHGAGGLHGTPGAAQHLDAVWSCSGQAEKEGDGKLKTTILPSPEHQLWFCSPKNTKKLELEKVHSILLHQFH